MKEATSVPASEPMAIDWLALGAALVTVVLWASAFVGIRAVADDLSPGALAVGRLLVGSLSLGVVVALRRPDWPSRRDLAWIAAVGVVWFGAYNVALNAAEQLVDAGTAAMLVNVGPILIALFAGLFLGEGFPSRLVVGSAIAFGGTIIIGLATSEGSVDASAPIGIVLCLVAALAYAAGVTIQKPILGRVAALQVTWLACCVGALVTLPFLPQLVGELGTAPISAVGWLVYLGVFPTAIAFTTWAFALNRTTAGRLGSTTYLVPPVAILLAWLVLSEVPAVLALAGGALCIGGVVVARSRGPSVSSAGR
jgi:drug/metabolite transporter (DMT)-like permease